MGLIVALFIPDAIVITSDSLAEVRQNDDGFYVSSIEKVFSVKNKYAFAIEGDGFYQGLPFSYYVNRVLAETDLNEANDIITTARILSRKLSGDLSGANYLGYLAGFDLVKGAFKPFVILIENGRVNVINQNQEQEAVFNFHTIGRNHWVNKIIMPAVLKTRDEEITLPSFDIDFSKYSIKMAREFANEMISISEKMDRFSQLKPMIGGEHQEAIISPFNGVVVTQ